MNVINIQAEVTEQPILQPMNIIQAAGQSMHGAPIVPVLPTGVPTTPVMTKQVVINTDISMLMNFNADLTSKALIGVMTVACQNVVAAPDFGLLCQATLDESAFDADNLVEYIFDLFEPENCSDEFVQAFCACSQQQHICRTCKTVEETRALYTEIIWEVIQRTSIPFCMLPKGYMGQMQVEAIGPDSILVRFP